MPLKVCRVYFLNSVPWNIQVIRNVLKCHSTEKFHYKLGKTVSIWKTAGNKGDVLLLVIVTFLVFAFVALYLHSNDYIPTSYWHPPPLTRYTFLTKWGFPHFGQTNNRFLLWTSRIIVLPSYSTLEHSKLQSPHSWYRKLLFIIVHLFVDIQTYKKFSAFLQFRTFFMPYYSKCRMNQIQLIVLV